MSSTKKKPLSKFTISLRSLCWLAFFSGQSYLAQPCRVVLDPGHGGAYISPTRLYGDKFDIQRGHYLDSYKPGARHREIYEHERVFRIAAKTRNLLLQTHDDKPVELTKVLAKFGKPPKNMKRIEVFLSRENSYFSRYLSIDEDINGPYRLFDYPDHRTGKMRKGTLSRMNQFSPHLVVSLHLTGGSAPKTGAMGAVITPSYQTFRKALDYVKVEKSKRPAIRKSFMRSPWRNWFMSSVDYGRFEMFLLDSWVYFTGRWSTPSGLEPRSDRFRGLRHNMVSWSYQNKAEVSAAHLRGFQPIGPFWEREQGKAEVWRREGGPEGYGGDNFYAAQQLLRFSRSSLILDKVDTERTAPEIIAPFVSTWSVPTYVNAVSAFLELGFLSNVRDRKRLTKHIDSYATGLAAGIYSLCYSMDTSKTSLKGEAIQWQRYFDYPGGNYFEQSLSAGK